MKAEQLLRPMPYPTARTSREWSEIGIVPASELRSDLNGFAPVRREIKIFNSSMSDSCLF